MFELTLSLDKLDDVAAFISSLNNDAAMAQGCLAPILRAAAAASERSVQEPAEKLNVLLTEIQGLAESALHIVNRHRDGTVPVTAESRAECARIITTMLNYVVGAATADNVEKLLQAVVLNLANAGPSSCVIQELAKVIAGTSTDRLDSLSGSEFERLITRLLSEMGFCAEITKASGDGGVDIIGTLNQPLTGGRFLVQCKRYAPDSPVGAAVVREFYGAVSADRRAVKGVLITTSGFTAQAREFAANLPIELIGRDQLLVLLETHHLLADTPVGDALTLLPASVQSMRNTLMGKVVEQHEVEPPAGSADLRS